MPGTVAEQLIEDHLIAGTMEPGEEIALEIDQTLTQDATGTLVMQELEAMGIDEVKTELSAQYVDHNLIQADHKNPDDHLFLQSACQKWGLWYSRPGNGVSHPVHQERFGIPGKTLLGSDSHTPAAGAIGMLAMGSGGLDVAMAIAGEPYNITMPEIWGVKLEGILPPWTSAKDIILEMLRRHNVDGGMGRIIEYHGPGVETLSAMDRHVIANMGTELGATSTVFPSDDETQRFLRIQQREHDYTPIHATDNAEYHHTETIDLSQIEPLIALPQSPGNVKPVADVQGEPIYQAYIGSSANPGLRDFAIPSMMVETQTIPDDVSFDVNPSTRQVLENLTTMGHLTPLIQAGARLHQAGCNGCIGMGQAPATDQNSLRTVPRNFPGRSGTREDRVHLVSPETATASALKGEITDPRTLKDDLDIPYPEWNEPLGLIIQDDMLMQPLTPHKRAQTELRKGPNIETLPTFEPIPDTLTGPILLKTHDNISTDEILPAGSNVLPYRSNIPRISEWTFDPIDPTFHDRATQHDGPFLVIGGDNYGQGSSREHAAIAPYHLGLRAVIAKSYARIHHENLANFGVLPLRFENPHDYDTLAKNDTLTIKNIRDQLHDNTHPTIQAHHEGTGDIIPTTHDLTQREIRILLKGGLIADYKHRQQDQNPQRT